MEVFRECVFVFLLFFSYSTLGYLAEIIFCSIREKKLIFNRGFLLGPYLPIYGVGAFVIIYWLNRYQDDIVALVVMGAVVCSLVEYFTSLIMEKIFKIRWWDYSHMKFNLNGRICLFNSFLFGLGSIIVLKFINPFYVGLLMGLSNRILLFIGVFFFVIFFLDVITSIIVLVQLKLNTNMLLLR